MSALTFTPRTRKPGGRVTCQAGYCSGVSSASFKAFMAGWFAYPVCRPCARKMQQTWREASS